jgi:hypothetical protein
MQTVLIPHPDFARPGVNALDVEITRPAPRVLALRYVLTAGLAEVRLPALAAPVRADGLWRRTCFEAFVRVPGGDGYCEFNLSPSTEWAAYGFDGYRAGMRSLEGIATPRVKTSVGEDHFVLEAVLDLDALADLPIDQPWRVGLSAVIEAGNGTLSYWALAHPAGRPDFHAADCFTGEVAAPGAA